MREERKSGSEEGGESGSERERRGAESVRMREERKRGCETGESGGGRERVRKRKRGGERVWE